MRRRNAALFTFGLLGTGVGAPALAQGTDAHARDTGVVVTRDVMVPESGLETAREVLRESEIPSSPDSRAEAYPITSRPVARLFLGLVAGAAVLGLVVWLVVMLNS